MEEPRPIGITLLALLDFALAASILVVPGFFYLFFEGFGALGGMLAFSFYLPTSFFATIADVAIGVGLLQRKNWAWKWSVILAMLGTASSAIAFGHTAVVTLVYGESTILSLSVSISTLLAGAMALWYLSQPNVRSYLTK